jgi:hypothetical protein
VNDLSLLADFSPLALFRDCHGNHVLMNIKADVSDKLVYEPSPYG